MKLSFIEPALRRMGYERRHRPFSEYLAFHQTLRAAKEAGLSVGDYIERRHAASGPTPLDQTMDTMAAAGVFSENLRRICEIGPGSGRYLERTLARCTPESYEIYETSEEWRAWLLNQYKLNQGPLTARTTSGIDLHETESGSVDLVQAHKVFSGVPLLVTLSYLREMARVARTGGWIVFDIMTESCFTPDYLQAWFDANPWQWDWTPHMVARQYALDLLGARGVSLVHSFLVPSHPAVAECLIFRRDARAAAAPSQ